MRMRQSVLGVALPLVLLILAASFGCGEPPPLDKSLLTGEPCEPPCWQGLTPGVSTEEEVYEFVRTSQLVDQTTLYIRDRTDATGEVVGLGVHWWSSANTAGARRQFGNNVMTKDGVVQEIMVFLDCEVTLADLLERYGDPHSWRTDWVAADIPDVDVTLYYPNHGFTAWLRLPADDTWLRPENKVRGVCYTRVVAPEDFLELGPEAGYFNAYEADSLRVWKGYGIVWF
jgi:hypothetical protein